MMANSNFNNTTQNNDMQRPKLRKIKRPKQHSGPIQGSEQTQNRPTQAVSVAPMEISPYRSQENPYPTQNISDSYVDNNYVSDENYGVNYGDVTVLTHGKLLMLALGCLLFGLFVGKLFFSSSQVVNNGLQGVVVNQEVPKGRARCGIAEKTQGCVLYIMNPQRQELNGRDFYDWASQLTGRQRFVIETGNMRYSTVKIKPGNIAQLNIPPLQ